MKQLLLSLALLTVSLNTTAQIKTFNKFHSKGDAFLGSPEYDFLYCDCFTITKDINGKYDAFIKVKDDGFEEKFTTIKIGIYAANDSLIFKTDWECVSLDYGESISLYDGSNLHTHLNYHIKNPDMCDCSQTNFPLSYLWQMITEAPGYIRFYIPTILGSVDFKAYTIPLYNYIMEQE